VVVHRTDAAEPAGLSSFDWLHVPATAMPMTLADIQRVWHDVFDPPGASDSPAPHGTSPQTRGESLPRCARWRLMVARAQAEPRLMTLRVVRDNGRCSSSSPRSMA